MALKNHMDTTQIDILVIEDDPITATALQRIVEGAGYSASRALTINDAIECISTCKPRIVLLDLSLPDGDGTNLIKQIKRQGVNEVIVISGSGDTEQTRKCLEAGVFDFIPKPADSQSIILAVRRADGARRLQERQSTQYPSALKTGFGSLEGVSFASLEMLAGVKTTASLQSFNALITGQPGVLKADVAALLHQYSGRSGEALIVSCSSEIDDQNRSRFFGVQQGDNPEHVIASSAYLNLTRGGTLVLDDLSALPIDIQHRLSVCIDSGEYLARQALIPTKLDCNIIGVLREPISSALTAGRLYEPLLYQLSINTINVPPLVERRDDIKFYALQAISQLNDAYSTEKSLSVEFLDQLTSYYWPGNLVELKNCLFSAYQTTEQGDEIKPNNSWFNSSGNQTPSLIKPFVGQRFSAVEKQLIEATLLANENNKSKTAKVLGISLKTLYNRLNTYSGPSTAAEIQ